MLVIIESFRIIRDTQSNISLLEARRVLSHERADP